MVSLTANYACAGEITVQGVDSTVPGNCANSYVVTRTWTFVDACGNPSSVSQTINVHDDIPPVPPVAPADVTVSCGGEVPEMISLTANDACAGEITVQGTDVVTPGECKNSFSVVRTWTFADACGNTSQVSQNIIVHDTTAPVISQAPENISISCSGDVPRPVSLTAIDNCSGNITSEPVDSIVQGDCPNSFVLTRTWTFVDDCGNPSSVSQIITVNDETPPVWESQNYVAETTVPCSAIPSVPEMVFSDNCGGTVTVTFEEHPENENPETHTYDLIRTWTATDLCGNVTVVTQLIHVTVAHFFDADNPDLCNNDSAYQNYSLTSLLPTDVNTHGEWHAAMQDPTVNALLESLINHENNTLNVTALPVGFYTLEYTVTSENAVCPITMEYYIHVVDDCGVLACRSLAIYNAVSPNNDSLNDVFYIENITDPCYFENNVKIYNRWGILVYDENGYNNADIAFNGISEGRSTLNKKEELPDGTYFYILKYRDADGWHDKSGYLYLNR